MARNNWNEVFHVPFLPSEWTTVKNTFENRNSSNCYDALQVVAAWRLRSSVALPFSVQASEVLLHAVLNDPVLLKEPDEMSFLALENLRMIYGMAVTRFVNYVTEHERQKRMGASIAEVCKKHGVAVWVVDVRHAATHGHMPSLNTLREAIDFCWDWLRTHYWNHDFLREGDDEVRIVKVKKPKLGRRRNASTGASTSAAPPCWSLAEDDVNWGDLPIGLGPGQQLEDLDFRIEAKSGEPPIDVQAGASSNISNGSSPVPISIDLESTGKDEDGAIDEAEPHEEESAIVTEEPSSNLPLTQDWNDDKRLELVQSLITFLGE